jgi:ribosome-associated protein
MNTLDIRKLQRAIVDGLEDVKAHNIVVFNTEHLSALFERVIVASGTSNRQTKALAGSVRDAVKARGLPVLSVEGADNGEWIIVDCGAAVAHIMQPAIRDYYRLEEIWGGKDVRMKIDRVAPRGAVASEELPAERPARTERRTAEPGAARAPAKSGAARTTASVSGARKGAAASRPRKGAAPSKAPRKAAGGSRSAPRKSASRGADASAAARDAAPASRKRQAGKPPARKANPRTR